MLCVDEYSQYSASESGRNLAKGCSREYYSLMDQQESFVWFPEPDTEDATPAHRGEPTTDWLKRSTNDRARATRRFFNVQISALPSNSQQDIFEALHNRDRYHSAFFELVVSRTLQTLGAEIEIEPGGAASSHGPSSSVSSLCSCSKTSAYGESRDRASASASLNSSSGSNPRARI